jgi:aerobic carbon-monoxide dehydrogenase medium subunit
MIAANFDYFAPTKLEDALRLLDQHGEDCKILAGGQSLIPVMKLRLASPAAVIDISRIPSLKEIKIEESEIRIGSNVTHAAIAGSKALREHCPLLVETALQIGDSQIRNRGTIGGSMVHADPAADWPAAMLALNASLSARSGRAERRIPAAEFLVDMMTSAISADEIVSEIRIPIPRQPRAAAYLKAPQSASGFALVGAAVQLEVENGICREIRIGVTGAAPKAYRAVSVEDALRGNPLDDAALAAACALADAEVSDPLEDLHASGEYRRRLTQVYTRRAILAALGRP